MLPHAGSSATPTRGAKVRISKACPDPSGQAPIAPTIAVGMRERLGFEGEDLLGGGQLDHGPAGSVVDPLVGEDTVPADAERPGDLADELFAERAVTDKGRSGEGQDALAAAHADQARGAFLHDTAGVLWCAAVVQPRACGTEGGVPGERQFTSRGEDPEPVVRLRHCGRQDERGLGQVRPARHALHLLVGQVRAVEDDGNWVAEAGRRGEHVDLHERT